MNMHTSPWARVDEDELRRLFDERLSAGRIGLLIGRSRSSVIGKLNRLGLKRGDTPTQGIGKRSRAPRKPVKLPPARAWLRKQEPAPKVVPFKPREPEKPLQPLNVGVYDLTPVHCRWPVSGEKEHTLFCGRPRVTGSSYCGPHAALATSAGTVSERQAHHIPQGA